MPHSETREPQTVDPKMVLARWQDRLKDLVHVLSMTLPLVACTVSVSQAASPGASEPRYLVFWGQPEKVLELRDRIGAVGDGKTRLLAFGLPNPTFDGESSLSARVHNAFRAARKHGIPVHLHFDFHIEWKERPDLWNCFDPKLPGYDPANGRNVEWSDWKGTPNRVRYLNWGVPQRIAPQMNLTSPVIRQEITRLVSRLIGPALKTEIDRLKEEGREYLFAGITVGSEPGIDDYSHPDPETARLMEEDGTPKTPLGFNALTSRGYGEKHPPRDFRRALAEVNADFVAFCAKQFVDAGIPPSRLYTHVAAPVPQESTTAPIRIAFNEYSRPGWTTYPVGPLADDFGAIYSELEKHGSPAWGGVEANVGIPGSWVSWEAYLARHFNHGATLVGINCGATGTTLPDLLTRSAFGDEAIAAYKKFLSGAPLDSKKEPARDDPRARLQGKMRDFQAGARKWQEEGRDLSPVGKIMQEFEPLMKQGKLPEAEAVLDRAIERLRGKTLQGP